MGDYTGAVLIYNMDHQYMAGYNFENGIQKKGRAAIESSENLKKVENSNGRIASTLSTQNEFECFTYYWITYYVDNGQITSIEPLYTWCVGDLAPIGGSGGGSLPPPTQGTNVTNNLNRPCFQTVWTHINNHDRSIEMEKILYNFNTDKTLNLTMDEFLDPNLDLDGQAQGPLVKLNENALQYASQEYIAATMYHEILHVWLVGSEGFINGEHNQMASNYVYVMRDALKEAFPNLSNYDAYCLAWGGLQNTTAWNILSATERSNIISRAQQFKNKNGTHPTPQGTPC